MMNSFRWNDYLKLKKYKDYYDGYQAILNKTYTDATKPISRIVTNYCDNIVNNYNGYLCGKPISYNCLNQDSIQDVLNYNDITQEDADYLKDALIYGVSYELQWIDTDAKERFSLIDPRFSFPIYDNTIERKLLYFVRYFLEENTGDYQNNFIVEVYDKEEVKTYRMVGEGGSMKLLSTKPHYYHQVPISIFELNREENSIFDKIISLQDAYNELQSSEIDDFSSFVDAYLVLTNTDADTEDIKTMKENRVIILGADAEASYLTKNYSDNQIQNMLDTLNDNIHKISASPDFNDDKFMAQSGVAMRYKLISFENNASKIEVQMRKALQKRIELICEILNIKSLEATWRDVEITFTRNLPEDLTDKITLVEKLRGLVSDETLLAQLPFIKDSNAEIEKLNAQKANSIALYDFTSGEGDSEE